MVAAEVATASPREPGPAEEDEEENEASRAVPLAVTSSTASVEAVAAVSRCSSTASSSVDAAALRARNGCAVEVSTDTGHRITPLKQSRIIRSVCLVLVLNYTVSLLFLFGAAGARRLWRGKLH